MAIDICQHCGTDTSGNNERKHRKRLQNISGNLREIYARYHTTETNNEEYLCRACIRTLNSLSRIEDVFRGRAKSKTTKSTSDSSSTLSSSPSSSTSLVVQLPASKKRKRDDDEVPCQSEPQHVPKAAQPVVRWLCRYHYLRAAKAITKIPGASRGLTHTVAIKIRQESRYFCNTSVLKGKSFFTINEAYKELEEKCPDMCRILEAIGGATNPSKLKPRIVAAAYILLNSRNQRVNTFQKIVGLLMWKGQIRSMMFRRMKIFGLCPTRITTLRLVDSLCSKFDAEIRRWKMAVELQENMQISSQSLGATECVGNEDDWMDMDIEDMDGIEDGIETDEDEGADVFTGNHKDHSYCGKGQVAEDGDVSEQTQSLQADEPVDNDESIPDHIQMRHQDHLYAQPPDAEDLAPGYQLIFDNVNIRKVARHKTTTSCNNQHNLVQVYAVKDRINCEHLNNDKAIITDIRELNTSAWWMDQDDKNFLKYELKILISRIGVQYIPSMKFLEGFTVKNIPHKFHSQSQKKSNVNKLGLINKDEMKVQEVVDIMLQLQQWCPETTDGRLHPIPFGGDGLSVVKSISAQKLRADGFTKKTQIKGLIPKPEDWHEGVIILQDIFTRHYKPASVKEVGTLYQLREFFNRRGVRASAKDAVNDNREFIHFVTHGFVVMAILHVLGMNNLDESPASLPAEEDTYEAKQTFLDAVATAVIDHFVFPRGVLPFADTPTLPGALHFDHKFNYVTSLMREGLLDIARNDAVRENDGGRIVLHWKYDFVHFFAFRHTNYMAISFRLLAQVFGLLTPRMAARMIFNRTVNVHGGTGKNISLDIFLEFLNKEVKDDLKRSGPNLTPKLFQRIGQSKQVMDEFLHGFDHDVEMFTGIGRHNKPDWSGEIGEMVTELKPELLFNIQPGRAFKHFPNFGFSKIHSIDPDVLHAWVAVRLVQLHLEHTKP